MIKRIISYSVAMLLLGAGAQKAGVNSQKEMALASVLATPIDNVPAIPNALEYEQQIIAFEPNDFISQVFGTPVVNTSALTPAELAVYQAQQLARDQINRELHQLKYEMLLDYKEQMAELKFNLAEISMKLQTCDWACIDQCAVLKSSIYLRTECFEFCGCYDGFEPDDLAEMALHGALAQGQTQQQTTLTSLAQQKSTPLTSLFSYTYGVDGSQVQDSSISYANWFDTAPQSYDATAQFYGAGTTQGYGSQGYGSQGYGSQNLGGQQFGGQQFGWSGQQYIPTGEQGEQQEAQEQQEPQEAQEAQEGQANEEIIYSFGQPVNAQWQSPFDQFITSYETGQPQTYDPYSSYGTYGSQGYYGAGWYGQGSTGVTADTYSYNPYGAYGSQYPYGQYTYNPYSYYGYGAEAQEMEYEPPEAQEQAEGGGEAQAETQQQEFVNPHEQEWQAQQMRAQLVHAQQRLEWTLRNAHPSQHNAIKAAEGPKLAKMYKDYIAFEVERTVAKMMSQRNVRASDFENMMLSAAQALKCPELCVSSCIDKLWTLEEKAQCLATCGCYDLPPGLQPPPKPKKAKKEPAAEPAAEGEAQALKQDVGMTMRPDQVAVFGIVFLGVALMVFMIYKRMIMQKPEEEQLLQRDSDYVLIH